MTPQRLEHILLEILTWSEQQNYKGYNKHDALNSPILNAILGWGKWPRIFSIQGIMRFPINLRPLLLVPKTHNPKGIALFVLGLLDLYQATNDESHLKKATQLLDLLLSIRSPTNWSGYCWGYHYPWRDMGFYAPTNTPNAVVTCFVCEAFIQAFRITNNNKYIEVVASSLEFLLKDLTSLKDTEDELCLSYMPMPMSMRVMDVSILIGAVASQYCQLIRNPAVEDTASRLVNFVVKKQTNYGAWYYTDPPGDSLIRHDNYHTGFILDALARHMKASGNNSYLKAYESGLQFYAENLFNSNGSPRWMSDKDYPHDIHGAAQGILTFSDNNNSYPNVANKIANWAISNMYDPTGRFYYQKTRFYTKKFTLLRWCNAWMFRSLSRLYLSLKKE